jgi:hypothetical protein
MKKSYKIMWGIVSVVIAIFLLNAVLVANGTKIYSIDDPDLGLIGLTFPAKGFLPDIFSFEKQNFYADKLSFTQSESIKGNSKIMCSQVNNAVSTTATIKLKIVGPTTKTISSGTVTLKNDIGSFLDTTYYWTVPASGLTAGTYKISDCWTCASGGGEICSDSFAKTITILKPTVTSCGSDVKITATVANGGFIWGSSIGSPTGLSYYRADTYEHYTLSSGTCKLGYTYNNWQTYCNDGYTCGSTQSTICSGKTSCKLISVPETPVVEQPPIVVAECSADATELCSDGTRAVIKSCVNGKYSSTGVKCPAVVIAPTNPTTNTTVTTTPANNVNGTTQQVVAETPSYTMLYIFGGIVLALVIILVVVIIRRR